MIVQDLTAQKKASWDGYVDREDQATLYHLSGWREVMEKVFGLKTHFLMACEGSNVQGVLPLLHIKSLLAGHYVTSMPGGMYASDDRAAEALLERAKEIVRGAGASYLILRDGTHNWDLPGLVTNEDHCSLVVDLSAGQEHVWRGVKKRYRQLTNKAGRSGVEVVNGTEPFERIYPVYSQSMRDKGTPTLGLGFFEKIFSEFPGLFQFLAVRHKDRFLGGGFITPFKDTVYCTWGGMLRESYDLRPNHMLYWETLKYGLERGLQWVDLGRSRYESGTYVFKKSWGAEPRQLYQQYFLNGIDQPPAVGGGRKQDPRYQFFVRAWTMLPVPLTEVLGPLLRKRMPFG